MMMIAIYAAGIISGFLLIAIALAGWIRQSGQRITRGGENNHAPGRIYAVDKPDGTNAGATPLEGHRAHRSGRHRRHTPRIA